LPETAGLFFKAVLSGTLSAKSKNIAGKNGKNLNVLLDKKINNTV